MSAEAPLSVAPAPGLATPPPKHLQLRPQSVVSASGRRAVRGKRLSSLHRNKSFDVYCDTDNEEPDTLQSSSSARQRRSRSYSALRPKNVSGSGGTTNAENDLQHWAKPGVPHLPTAHLIPLPLSPKPPNVRTTAGAAAVTTPTKTSNRAPELPKIEIIESQDDNSTIASDKSTPQSSVATPPSPSPSPYRSEPAAECDTEQWDAEVARLEAETDRILAEQKKRDLARLQAQLDATTTPTTPRKPTPSRLILDKFFFFTRSAKSSEAGSQPTTPKSATSTRTFSLAWSPTAIKFLGVPSPAAAPDTMAFIEQGGGVGGVVPGIDAPASASNGGERRVTVRCLSSTINLPVTPETTSKDIIYATANFIPQKISAASCIVVECYDVLGLERRIRRYEHIRDIMNSWDRDQQNSLVVVTEEEPESHRDLDLSHVPRSDEPPTGFTFQLYHCSRPGKWNKRWITLMDSGQIYASKRSDSKATDKDSTSICHLSDFDIYTPRESQMKRHIKPPKTYCYGVKSQQRANVFANQELFMQFFSTSDRELANRFYELIHRWRCWYVATKQIDIFNKKKTPPSSSKVDESLKKTMSLARKNTTRHAKQMSVDSTKPYTIGDFTPLIDMTRFDKPIEEFGKNLPVAKPAPKPPIQMAAERQKERSRPNVLTKQHTYPAPAPRPGTEPNAFLSGGLLGDAYDKRKLEEQQAPAQVKKNPVEEGPFTQGPSLLNQVKPTPASPQEPEASPWLPSAIEHTARSTQTRSKSVRPPTTADASRFMPQPLVNLNEAPPMPSGRGLHRSGTGRAVRPTNGGPLIDYASNLSNQQSNPIPPRANARATVSGANSIRPRSRSVSNGRPPVPGQTLLQLDQPPVPPLPERSVRRPGERVPSGTHRGRPDEPLINRIR